MARPGSTPNSPPPGTSLRDTLPGSGRWHRRRPKAPLSADRLAIACRAMVERLMRVAALVGVSRRKGTRTTIRDDRVRPANDLVDRNFRADAPDQLWGEPRPVARRGAIGSSPMGDGPRTMASDITYVPTRDGFIHLSPRHRARSDGAAMARSSMPGRAALSVGRWATISRPNSSSPLGASHGDVPRGGQRRPANVIHHGDRGSRYTSVAFGLRCKGEAKPNGVRPSMGSVDDAYDNAPLGRSLRNRLSRCPAGSCEA